MYKYFNAKHVDELIELLKFIGQHYLINNIATISPDPKDDFLFCLGKKKSKADYLITGDFELLAMKSFGMTKILSAKNFQTIFS